MPGKNRIVRADFKHMRGFKRLSGALFSLSFGSITGRRVPGAAVVVSKKVAAKAATRNLIKRRARAVLVEALHKDEAPHVFVLVAKKGASEAGFRTIQSDVRALMARARASR